MGVVHSVSSPTFSAAISYFSLSSPKIASVAESFSTTPILGLFGTLVQDWIPLIDEYYYCMFCWICTFKLLTYLQIPHPDISCGQDVDVFYLSIYQSCIMLKWNWYHMSLWPGLFIWTSNHIYTCDALQTYSQTIMSYNLPTVRRIVTHHNPQGISSIETDSEVIFQVSFHHSPFRAKFWLGTVNSSCSRRKAELCSTLEDLRRAPYWEQ